MKKPLIVCVTLIVGFLICAYVYAMGTPQYSLYQFRKAVENHDVDSAMQYLDVDSIVDHFASDYMKSDAMAKPKNNIEAMGQNIAKGFIAMMIPAVKETIKSQFKAAITTPSEDKTTVKDINKLSLSDIVIKVDGKLAVITSKQDHYIKFTMSQTSDRHWKIVQMVLPNPI